MKRPKNPESESPRRPKYEVGYGKPPPKHQFKKGRSGNAAGRPKGRKNSAKSVAEVLSAPVDVRKGSREAKMPFREAMLRQLCQAVLRREPRAVQNLVAVVGKENIFPPEIEDDEPQLTAADDLEIIMDFIERRGGELFEDFNIGERKRRS